MKVNIIIHKNAELDDWEEKVSDVLKSKVSPISITFSWVENEFELPRGVQDGLNVAVLAPKKGTEPLMAPIVDRLMEKDVRIFYTSYEDAPSSLEDFIQFLLRIMGVEG